MEKEEYSAEDFKYIRTGYIPGERNADTLVQYMTDRLPGDGVLPHRWRWLSQESFVSRYGDLGMLLWAKAASYHMLMFNGHHILRLWTDSADTCVVDLCDSIARTLDGTQPTLQVEDIPESCYRKCKPFKKRTRVSTTEELHAVLLLVYSQYGLMDYWRH